MKQLHDKKNATLWLAVAGTMAVVVTLWLLQLPSQLERLEQSAASPVSRWGVRERSEAPEEKKTLGEVIEEQRRELEKMQQQVQAEATAEAEQPAEEPADDILDTQKSE